MSKRNQRVTRSWSSSSSQYQLSPKRLLRDWTPSDDDDHVSLCNIMDKLCDLESRMGDLSGSLKSEISCLRYELSEEIDSLCMYRTKNTRTALTLSHMILARMREWVDHKHTKYLLSCHLKSRQATFAWGHPSTYSSDHSKFSLPGR